MAWGYIQGLKVQRGDVHLSPRVYMVICGSKRRKQYISNAKHTKEYKYIHFHGKEMYVLEHVHITYDHWRILFLRGAWRGSLSIAIVCGTNEPTTWTPLQQSFQVEPWEGFAHTRELI